MRSLALDTAYPAGIVPARDDDVLAFDVLENCPASLDSGLGVDVEQIGPLRTIQ